MLEFYIVIFGMIVMLSCLVFELERPEIVLPATLLLFVLTGVITPQEATRGFSNEGMLTIGLLFIIAGSIQNSGIVDRVFQMLLNHSTSRKHILAKILFPISFLSAFLNNTPIVIAFTPLVKKWCEDHHLSPSKFLIPLSYATILGGTITLIGTSTNLVVHGLLLDHNLRGFTFFELSKIGVPITLVGLCYLVFFSSYLLPNRHSSPITNLDSLREFTGEILVLEEFPYINKTVEQARLRSLKGLFLVSIIRDDEIITPVTNTTVLKENDRLIFIGDITTITELQFNKGLELQSNNGSYFPFKQLVEAVVSHHSTLLFKKIKDTNFRSRHNAAVLAVHRQNQRIKAKIGDVVLKPGDILLLVTGPDFHKKVHTNDFYYATPIDNKISTHKQSKQGWFSIALLGTMILLVTLSFLSMLTGMACTALLLFLLKIVSAQEVKNSIQWNVLLLVSCSFGIGYALINSGVAAYIATILMEATRPLGVFAVILAIYLLTNIFTEMMTNSAAAVMMFPIILEVSRSMDLDPIALAVTVTIAASASFATPIGYQTNLIVYGPGGYQFKDFLKAGIPLNIITMLTTAVLIYFFWL
ncbi:MULTISPECIES: SLC13 family permease [Rossellomorea]|jgi:di/tricarboxylate transporter|uniref:SLC13 family permease n=1 Tax=Rossellomorea TaxID=2837508 RepID=UPI0011E8C4E6|nr:MULTISPECIES: SLC13 family permease [Rossellomorea]MDT9024019.1 SLC13 family permease [Rossellomorea sp. YC4-1]TYS91229.1 SLC13 family permease [Rossellomorea aquimaris]